MTIMMRQISQEAPAASSVNPALPSGIDDVIAWLMQKDPAARPPNLTTASRALDAAAEQAGIAVPRAPISAPIDIAVPRMTMPPNAAGVATTLPPAAATPKKSRAGLFVAAGLGA